MCSISGILIGQYCKDTKQALQTLKEVIIRAEDRGRDSWGYYAKLKDGSFAYERFIGRPSETKFKLPENVSWLINNNRAEPTTEYVKHKSLDDVQPFIIDNWVVAHNGTIANDKGITRKYGLTTPTSIDSSVIPALLDNRFSDILEPESVVKLLTSELVGSYALAIGNNRYSNELILLVNYKPLYLAYDQANDYLIFTSLESYVNDQSDISHTLKSPLKVVQIPPYSAVHIKATKHGITIKNWSIKPKNNKKALVVCSGGLDSTVVATKAIRDGYDVTLLHFLYGCRAEEKEKAAIIAIANRLKCRYEFVSTSVFTETIGGSPLTNTTTSKFSDGISGSEFAHEWVPSRNLIMLSVATGIAESHGYDTIMLGNNLEESGCLSGDTIVQCQRSGNYYNWTLKELYERIELGKHWGVRYNPEIPTLIRTQLPNGATTYLPIEKVFKSGIKPVIRISLDDGSSVLATSEHEWFTLDGWKRTDALTTSDEIYSNGRRYEDMSDEEYSAWRRKLSEAKRGDKNPNKKRENADRIRATLNMKTGSEYSEERGYVLVSGMSFHPYHTVQRKIYKHRLIIEAAINNVSYEEWISKCRSGKFDGSEEFLDPEISIHHKDGNKLNNEFDNLEVCPSESYHQLLELGHLTVPKKIISLERCLPCETYDVSVSGTHNYLANKMVGHNSYPDNEMQFILKFSDVLPYATQVGKHVSIQMPVGNLMKHEIVKLGLEIGAPLDLTWSCYDNGDLHCGECGPCFMRKTAFQINNKPEVIKYLK